MSHNTYTKDKVLISTDLSPISVSFIQQSLQKAIITDQESITPSKANGNLPALAPPVISTLRKGKTINTNGQYNEP